VTFNSTENQSGWQVATLGTPVVIIAGVEYIVSYRTENNYISTNDFFDPSNEVTFDGLDNDAFTDPFGVLSASQGNGSTGSSSNGNGVYKYGADLVVPNDTFNDSNYWVDVTFDPTYGPNDTPVITSNGGGDTAAISITENTTLVTDVNATDSNLLTYSLDGGADQAKFSINSTTGVLSFLTAPNFEAPTDEGGNNVYDVIVRASDGSLFDTQAITVTVTDVAESASSSLFGPTDVPTNFVSGNSDATNYELGTKFTASQVGTITALQYFRGAVDADDTDVRTLNLWSGGGVNLGSVTVTSAPGASGWQIGTLASPITITAGPTYIVSYGYVYNNGDGNLESYAATGGYFNIDRPGPSGILTAPAGSNGVYNFAPGPGSFPTNSFNSSNYWVDVLFSPGGGGPTNTPPVFTSPVTFTTLENQVLVGMVAATDVDGNPLTYGIAGGADGALFKINPTTGFLQFRNPQDFESRFTLEAGITPYNLTVSVSDGVAPAVTQNITVSLADVNEAVVGPAAFTGATLTGEYIFGTAPTTLFPGDGASQTATVGSSIEFQNLPNAGSAVGNGIYGLSTVDVGAQTIRIEFPLDPSVFSQAFVPFASASTHPFNGVRIADTSNGLPTILSASIIGQEGFTNSTGTLQGLTNADLTVTADGIFLNVAGKGRLVDVDSEETSAQASYVTLLVDLNDAPVITSDGGEATTSTSTPENTTFVTTLTATDPDIGQTLSYSIVPASGGGAEDSALFEIRNGNELHFNIAPDFENPPSAGSTFGYDVTVQVSDGKGGIDTQVIKVSLSNVDEVTPTITSDVTGTVTENAATSTVIYTITSDDTADISAGVTYSLSGTDAALLSINASGEVTLQNSADYEAKSTYSFDVLASDGVNSTTSKSVVVSVINLDEVAPTITSDVTGTVAENAATSTVIYTITSDDTADISAGVTYSLSGTDAALLSINASGEVTLKNSANYEAKSTYSFDVLANDGVNSATSKSVVVSVININDIVPIFNPIGGSDNIINASEVAIPITGTIDAAVTQVTLKIGSTTRSAIVTGSTWSYNLDSSDITSLGQGTGKTIIATAKDTANNTTQSTSAIFAIDTIAPTKTVTITSMTKDTGTSSADFLTNDGTSGRSYSGTLSAALTPASESLQVSVDGGTTWSNVTNFPTSKTWTFVDSTPKIGNWTIQSRVVDNAGNAGPTASKAVTLDQQISAASLVIPDLLATSDSGISSTDNITNVLRPTIAVSFESANTKAGDILEIRNGNNILLGSATLTSAQVSAGAPVNITLSSKLPGLSLGVNKLSAVQRDVAGNIVTGSTLDVTYDNQISAASAVTLDLQAASDSGISSTDNITNNTTPTFAVTFDVSKAQVGDILEIRKGSTVLGSTTLSATQVSDGTVNVTLSTNLTSFTSGSNTLSAVHRDIAGNRVAGSPTLAVTRDTTAPTAPVLVGYNSTSMSVNGTAETGSTLKFSTSSSSPSSFAGATATASAGNFAIDFFGLPGSIGGTSYYLYAQDVAGNLSPASSQRVVVGTSGDDDILTGVGGGGSDLLVGGNGIGDIAQYSVASNAIAKTGQITSATGSVNIRTANIDVLTGIEGIDLTGTGYTEIGTGTNQLRSSIRSSLANNSIAAFTGVYGALTGIFTYGVANPNATLVVFDSNPGNSTNYEAFLLLDKTTISGSIGLSGTTVNLTGL
jgi:hypothetical protein